MTFALSLVFSILLAASGKAAPAGAAPQKGKFSVLTFNLAGVPVIHPKVRARMTLIGKKLAGMPCSVAALQEVWLDGDAAAVAKEAGYPHVARNPKGGFLAGDGLVLLSRAPILETRYMRYSDRFDGFSPQDGEMWAHKGAQMARIQLPDGPVDVYNTHLVADYKEHGRFNPQSRRIQLEELAAFIKEWSPGRRVILAGDLNLIRAEPDFQKLAKSIGLADACLSGGKDACAEDRGDKRIDYVLGPPGTKATVSVEFTGKVTADGREVYWSDHLGLLASFGALPSASGPALVSKGRPARASAR